MSRIATYARVSSAELVEGQSIEAQLEKLREYAQTNSDSITGEFGDAGFQGDVQDRPGLSRMVKAAQERRFDVLYVFRFDRLFSDVCSFLNTERRLRSLGVQVISITEPLDESLANETVSDRRVGAESDDVVGAPMSYESRDRARRNAGYVQNQMPEVNSLMNEYLDHLQYNLNFASSTIRQMRLTFTHLSRYWGDLTKLTTDMITQKKMEMLKADQHIDVTKRRIRLVVSFLEWLRYSKSFPVAVDVSRVRADLKTMRLPRLKHKIDYFSRTEFEKLINLLDVNDIRQLRLRALLELLFGTALRISEALALNRDVIKPERFTIIGKGRKERTIYITQRAYDWVQRYLDERTDNEAPLFVGLRHAADAPPRRLKYGGFFDQFEEFRTDHNLPEWFTAHTLRRSVATILYLETHDITLSRDVLGHENVATTDKYYRGADENETLRRFRAAVEPALAVQNPR
jgi:site-specific recombinase XerD